MGLNDRFDPQRTSRRRAEPAVTLPIVPFARFRTGNPHVVLAGRSPSPSVANPKENIMYIGIGTLLLIIILIILFT
jgi:hypothetical protein